jgi:hypothetical protein
MPVTNDQLSEENRAILSQLSIINVQLQSFIDSNQKLHKEIYGNGGEGMKIKVDRLEQSQAKNSRTVQAVISACVSTIIVGLSKLLFHN